MAVTHFARMAMAMAMAGMGLRRCAEKLCLHGLAFNESNRPLIEITVAQLVLHAASNVELLVAKGGPYINFAAVLSYLFCPARKQSKRMVGHESVYRR